MDTKCHYLDIASFYLNNVNKHLNTVNLHLGIVICHLDTASIHLETARHHLDTARVNIIPKTHARIRKTHQNIPEIHAYIHKIHSHIQHIHPRILLIHAHIRHIQAHILLIHAHIRLIHAHIQQIHTYIEKIKNHIQKTTPFYLQIIPHSLHLKENNTMFKPYIAQTFQLLGRKPKITTLVKIGVANTTAHNLLNGKANNIKLSTLFRICEMLNCTPNDLFDIADKDFQNLPPNHQLRKIKKPTIQQSPIVLANNIPLDRFDEASKLLEDFLKGSEGEEDGQEE